VTATATGDIATATGDTATTTGDIATATGDTATTTGDIATATGDMYKNFCEDYTCCSRDIGPQK